MAIADIGRVTYHQRRRLWQRRLLASSNVKKLIQGLNGTGDPVQLREAKRLLINLLELRELYMTMRAA
jgi:hypothetical protein